MQLKTSLILPRSVLQKVHGELCYLMGAAEQEHEMLSPAGRDGCWLLQPAVGCGWLGFQVSCVMGQAGGYKKGLDGGGSCLDGKGLVKKMGLPSKPS